jgi:hypothetical protein
MVMMMRTVMVIIMIRVVIVVITIAVPVGRKLAIIGILAILSVVGIWRQAT